MIICPKCAHENRDGAKICDKCGNLLVDASSTRKYEDTNYEEGDPRWGSARFRGTLVLDVVDTQTQFVFQGDQIEEVVLGRSDPTSTDKPAVDLAESNALEKGVSRRHAMILQKEGILHVMDNSSANGTYLNGQRLAPLQSRILRDGDDIRLGHLVLRVTFRPGIVKS